MIAKERVLELAYGAQRSPLAIVRARRTESRRRRNNGHRAAAPRATMTCCCDRRHSSKDSARFLQGTGPRCRALDMSLPSHREHAPVRATDPFDLTDRGRRF